MALTNHPNKKQISELKKVGINQQDVSVFFDADMDLNCIFADSFLVITDKYFHIVKFPPMEKVRYFEGYPHETKDQTIYESPAKETYNLSDIDRAGFVELVSGGSIFITLKGENLRICTLTCGKNADARRFCDIFNKILSGNIPDSDDFVQKESEEFCPKCGTMYMDKDRKICPKCMNKKSVFIRCLAYFKPYTLALVAIMLLCCIDALVIGLGPYLTGTVYFDDILNKGSDFTGWQSLADGSFVTLLHIVLAMYLGLKIFEMICMSIRSVFAGKMVPRVVRDIKCDIFSSMKRLSLKFFTDRQTGALMTRVLSDASELTGFFLDTMPFLLYNVFLLLAIAIIMFSMNWQLTVYSLVLIPLLVLVSMKLRPRLFHLFGKRHRAARGMNAVLNDSLTGARVVKAFGQENETVKLFDKQNKKMRLAEIFLVKHQNWYSVAYSTATNLMIMAVWVFGAVSVLNTANTPLSYGVLAAFVSYVGLMARPINFMSDVFVMWANSMNAAQRIFEIVDAKPDVEEKENPLQLNDFKGEVELKKVVFSYEAGHPVLNDISFKIEAGQILGLVGRSGVGKTTLVNLISRLYDVDSGEILLDGVNVKDISFDTLRKNVAMVSQDTYIFMGTVADNISYADPKVSRDKIIQAAVAAGAHDFICRLPDGYDTLVGTSGRSLSGGERQRISIARAIIADPKILILDEATSAVDTKTEQRIQTALDRLVEGKTTISIAHRLSTLNNADILAVLEDGKLAEWGTHKQLIEQKGIYYKLAELQTKALALEK